MELNHMVVIEEELILKHFLSLFWLAIPFYKIASFLNSPY